MIPRALRLKTLRNKLALVFFAITATAFAVIYFVVVPQLESNLQERKLDDLELVAKGSESDLESLMGRGDVTAREVDRRVRATADAAGARVTLLGVQQSGLEYRPRGELRFFVITDSREEREVPENRSLVARAAISRKLVRGQGSLGGERLGEIAQPLSFQGEVDWVALYSRSFDDVAETVSFIRGRLLAATAAALLVALIGGYLVAGAPPPRRG